MEDGSGCRDASGHVITPKTAHGLNFEMITERSFGLIRKEGVCIVGKTTREVTKQVKLIIAYN